MKTYHFNPRLMPTVLCLALLLLLLGLGRWQWSRAEYKTQLEQRQQMALKSQPLGLAEAVNAERDRQGFPLRLSGVLDNTRSLLLDNQMEGGRPGYQVYTLLLTAEGKAVWVSRGWLAATADRRLPALPDTRAGVLTLQGKLYQPDDKQVVLKADDYSHPRWPLLVQKLDIPALAAVLRAERPGVELAPFVLRLDPEQDVEQGNELVRHWHWVTMGSEKHRGYAFQWFGMALVLFVLYVVFSSEKKLLHE